MTERRGEHVESADHETLSDTQMLTFWRAYEAAQRQPERPARSRSVEAAWAAKRRTFLEQTAKSLTV